MIYRANWDYSQRLSDAIRDQDLSPGDTLTYFESKGKVPVVIDDTVDLDNPGTVIIKGFLREDGTMLIVSEEYVPPKEVKNV